MMPTNIAGRSAKVAVPIEDGAFPVEAIPARGLPGSAKARITLRLRTADGVELVAEPAAKGLQKAQDAALEAPGGFWVVQGRLARDGQLLEAGVVYQPPRPSGTS